jgi:methylated-DNA-protein-cysteine methyltransferase-like protein
MQYYHRIWQTVQQIPAGYIASYGQIADLAGLPGRARLVSKALQASPNPLPWHRVVRSNGQIAFVAGSKEALSQIQLLRAEGVQVQGHRVAAQYKWQPALADLLFRLQF